jgi:hypothetical protein
MSHSSQGNPSLAWRKVDETQIPCTARQFREGHGGVEREVNVGVPLGVRRGHPREFVLGKLPICHLSSSGLGEAPTGSGWEFCLNSPPTGFAPGTWFFPSSGGSPENAAASADIDWVNKNLCTSSAREVNK